MFRNKCFVTFKVPEKILTQDRIMVMKFGFRGKSGYQTGIIPPRNDP